MTNPVIDLRKLRDELKSLAVASSPAIESVQAPAAAMIESDLPGRAGSSGTLFEWEASEFTHNDERRVLLVVVGALLFAGAVAAIFARSYLFAMILGIAGALVIAAAYREPRTFHFSITRRGVSIGERLYLFDDLKSFWVSYDPPLFKDLIVVSQKTFVPVIRVPLGELDPVRLREILLRFLPEERHEESLIDIVSRQLGL